MRKILTLLAVCIALCGCNSGCSTAQSINPSLDVIHNRVLNTKVVPANGDVWKFDLPPNFVTVKHDVGSGEEILFAKSRFLTGGAPILVTVSAFQYDKIDKDEAYKVTNSEVTGLKGWAHIFGPKEVSFGENKGSLLIGSHSEQLGIVFQFTIVQNSYVYILLCSGSMAAKNRIGIHCRNMVKGFKPTGAPHTVPLLGAAPLQ